VAADLLLPDDAGIAAAAAALLAGDLVGLPTETVYGLAADARDEAAVRRIFAAKGRPADNPLIVHLASPDAFPAVVAEVTPLARRLADRFCPGPLTLVLAARPELPRVTTGGLATVAVRVPDHPVATAVLEAAGIPVAAPSANRSGRPSPTTAADVVAELGDAVAVVIDGGPCPVGVESTVVDARGEVPVVLREGSITREDLGLASTDQAGAADIAASPGTRYRHYAPACEVVLAAPGEGAARASELRATLPTGVTLGLVAPGAAPPGVVEVARVGDAVDLARRLYRTLRDAEVAGVDVLVVEAVEERGIGRAVMDRLRRAAAASSGSS
jgi:L-threonylcarbamoyladenylate synthase